MPYITPHLPHADTQYVKECWPDLACLLVVGYLHVAIVHHEASGHHALPATLDVLRFLLVVGTSGGLISHHNYVLGEKQKTHIWSSGAKN